MSITVVWRKQIWMLWLSLFSWLIFILPICNCLSSSRYKIDMQLTFFSIPFCLVSFSPDNLQNWFYSFNPNLCHIQFLRLIEKTMYGDYHIVEMIGPPQWRLVLAKIVHCKSCLINNVAIHLEEWRDADRGKPMIR